jgi:hypothetical protein
LVTSKADEFEAIIREFSTLAANQEIIKDEAIQASGERTMAFIMENADLILRGLRLAESC